MRRARLSDVELAVGLVVEIRDTEWTIREILLTEGGRCVLVCEPMPGNICYWEPVIWRYWDGREEIRRRPSGQLYRFLTELDEVYAASGNLPVVPKGEVDPPKPCGTHEVLQRIMLARSAAEGAREDGDVQVLRRIDATQETRQALLFEDVFPSGDAV